MQCLDERTDETEGHAKHSLVCKPRPLPSYREIPGHGENLEPKVYHAHQSRTRPVPLNRHELHISSAGASRSRALTSGSPALYQLSYGTDKTLL